MKMDVAILLHQSKVRKVYGTLAKKTLNISLRKLPSVYLSLGRFCLAPSYHGTKHM